MSEIKKVNISTITNIYGLTSESNDFLFKPNGLYPILEYEPFRTSGYSIGLVLSGEKILNIGLDSYNISAPGLLVMGPELIRQWIDDKNHIDGMILYFTEDFILSGLSDSFFIKNFPYFAKTGYNYLQLNPELFETFKRIFDQIEAKNQTNHRNKLEVIRSYIRILLYEVEEVYVHHSSAKKTTTTQGENIARKFKKLLEQHFVNHREVQFYADQLFITTKHLSQTLKEQTGKTASDWIKEIVVLEAKVLLQNKENTIAQISDQLNFANPSFFGKFFKRNTTLSPKEYRNISQMKAKYDL
ncbi:MAG: AraC family transcriptional regulator [Marinifilaceae bacterium]